MGGGGDLGGEGVIWEGRGEGERVKDSQSTLKFSSPPRLLADVIEPLCMRVLADGGSTFSSPPAVWSRGDFGRQITFVHFLFAELINQLFHDFQGAGAADQRVAFEGGG